MKKSKCGKICSFILIVSLVVSIMIPNNIYANPGDDPVMKNGEITWETEGKKSTGGIYYRTVGWTIHKTPVASGNITSSGVAYGSMTGGQSNEYDSSRPGYVITEFTYSVNDVDTALRQADKNLEWKEGETVYLSAIMEVRSGNKVLGTYRDLSKLKASQSWANPSDFDQYFNKKVKLSFGPQEVHKIIKVNGSVVSDTVVQSGLPGATTNVTFDKTYSYNGKSATIKKSYIEKRLVLGTQLFPLDSTNASVTNRNTTIPVGGVNIVAEYTYNPTVTVEHMNLDSGSLIESTKESVVSGAVVSKSSNTYTDKQYIYSEISTDGGKTWTQRSDKTTRTFTTVLDTTIRFNYSANSDLLALLDLKANPNMIEKGKSQTVSFTLDASKSTSKKGVKKYEFWFGSTDEFKTTPDYTGTSSTKIVSQSNVTAGTTWYSKVRVTDNDGKTSEATSSLTIRELTPIATATATADLELNVVYNTPRVEMFDNEWGDVCFLDIYVPEYWKEDDGRYQEMDLDFTLDASKSKSTNGIGNYTFRTINMGGTIYSGPNSSTGQFNITFPMGPQDVINGTFDNQYDSVNIIFEVTVTDSLVPGATSKKEVELMYRYIFDKTPPKVTLTTDRENYAMGEDVLFTANIATDKMTYDVKDKYWEIYSASNDFKAEGDGQIPNSYKMDVEEGKYIARQYITYLDKDRNEQTVYAEVIFYVWGIRAPDVSIASDKNTYLLPTNALMTVIYEEDTKFSYPIESKSYAFTTKSGTILAEGEGTFPSSFAMGVDLDAGYYIAEQTITWYEEGMLRVKTAQCEFRLISPVPTADFEVKMKTSTTPTWERVDISGGSGKQYRQIQINLTPSIALNTSLENPYPLIFTNSNTQIQVLPLDDSNAADRSKNSTIRTPVSTSKQIVDDTVTFIGKQYIDIRFDQPGKYRIKAKVANQYYTSKWLVRDIIIREDLPPLVTISFEDVATENSQFKVFRNATDLRVRFKVLVDATPQDDDSVNFSNSKLEIRYDYNADNDASNDGVHSQMYVSTAGDNLQSYITVNKSADNKQYSLEMFSSTFPILGKMRFEYIVGETPTIPYYTGGSMPAIPAITGTTYGLAMEQKVVIADNIPGNIKVELGKDSKIEVTIVMGVDTLHFDLNTLKAYYGENAKIYVVDKNGNRELVN